MTELDDYDEYLKMCNEDREVDEVKGKILTEHGTQSGGRQIVEQYNDVILNCLTGISGVLDDISRLNEFCTQMAIVALEDDSYGIAFSCFVNHGSPYNQLLPIPVEMMNEDAFKIFVNLLSDSIALGWSKSGTKYVEDNIESIKTLADHGNPYAQWLSAIWYKPDDFETNEESIQIKRLSLFEKSATAGFIPAIAAAYQFYLVGDDDASISIDYKKAAYWCRQGALMGDPASAFNLGILYSQGMFVAQNRTVASIWLSTAYNNSGNSSMGISRDHILEYANSHNIELVTDPDLRFDPELSPHTAEFTSSIDG